MAGANDGGTSNDLPWASVFDSAANMRALSAIQADGFPRRQRTRRAFRPYGVGRSQRHRRSAAPAAVAADERNADLFGATGSRAACHVVVGDGRPVPTRRFPAQ